MMREWLFDFLTVHEVPDRPCRSLVVRESGVSREAWLTARCRQGLGTELGAGVAHRLRGFDPGCVDGRSGQTGWGTQANEPEIQVAYRVSLTNDLAPQDPVLGRVSRLPDKSWERRRFCERNRLRASRPNRWTVSPLDRLCIDHLVVS